MRRHFCCRYLGPTRIVIGSDSKRITATGKERNPVCKTTVADNIIAGQAGIYDVSFANFLTGSFISTALSTEGNLHTKITSLETSIIPPLTAILSSLSLHDPMSYKQRFSGRSAVEIIFAGYEDGIVKFETRDFVATSGITGNFLFVNVLRLSCPGDACPSPPVYVALGLHELIDAEIFKDRQMTNRMGFENAVRHLIQIEVDGAPSDVGPPIAVAELTSAGVSWISKGECTGQ